MNAGPATFPKDRPLHTKRRLIVFGLGVGAFLLFQILLFLPGLTDTVFGRLFNPPVIWSVSRLTGFLPFSIVELCIVAYVVVRLFYEGRAIRNMIRRERSVRNALASVALIAARDVGIVIFLFYVAWGFNYARPPLANRLDWPVFATPDSAERVAIAEESIRNVNAAYLALHGTEDIGHPTPAPDLRDLNAAIDVGYERVTDLLDLPGSMAWHYGQVKQPLSNRLFAWFGIAGIYVPWTAEPHIVPQPLAHRAFTIGHEKAHQRGVGPELEASFLGVLAASLAPDAAARYSAAFYAHGRLIRLVGGEDRRRLMAMRLPGVERDRRDLNAWWEQYEGWAELFATRVNDQFLRTNRVAGGVRSYDLVVRLLIQFQRQTGSLIPTGDSP